MVSAVNRRLAPLLLVPLLASCSLEDVAEFLGPQPNPEVAALADRAHADGRTAHAAELEAEIARLCGAHEDGSVPDSCAYTPTPVEPGDAFLVTVDAVDAVPAESRDLIARQSVELATQAPGDHTLLQAEAEQARALLRAEFATLHGLEVARAFHSPDLTDPLIDATEHRITLLRGILEPTGDVPVAEPGYELREGADPASPEFVAQLGKAAADTWLTAVRDAQADAWREWLAQAAYLEK